MGRHPDAVHLCRVVPGTTVDLAGWRTDWLPDAADRPARDAARARSEAALEENRRELADVQGRLYASMRYGVLVVLQAMDAGGKDGVIRHVLSGVNPQGCEVTSFKAPSDEELAHHYLWRYTRRIPPRGMIGIFNRSYYEEVLVVRVDPAVRARQRLPGDPATATVWARRFEDINALERHLDQSGIKVVKLFLHLSKSEQRDRFLARIDDPTKQWKFSLRDLEVREQWDDYQRAYAEAISATSTPWAPWYIVPADRKWLTRALVSEILVDVIDDLGVEYPRLAPAEAARLPEVREALRSDT
jgi:PPK2 family polyphosphate:nucleotide phosphotransferase